MSDIKILKEKMSRHNRVGMFVDLMSFLIAGIAGAYLVFELYEIFEHFGNVMEMLGDAVIVYICASTGSFIVTRIWLVLRKRIVRNYIDSLEKADR